MCNFKLTLQFTGFHIMLCFFLFIDIDLFSQVVMSEKTTISRSSAEVGVGDFDKDGHVDIAICNSDQRWYAGPDYSTWYSLGSSDGGPYAARVADINGDGWLDFVTSDGTRTSTDIPGELYVYLNPTDTGDVYGPWERVLVYSGNVRHQNDLRVLDMDGDGRLDIIERTWSEERVVVALQNQDINNWTVRAFDTGETGRPEGISAGDVDGDGENEIVLSGVYWDNPGGWRSGDPLQFPVDINFIQEEVKSAVGDIDNDGDNDIYMGSCEGGYVYLAWYENIGLNSSGGVNFSKHIIKNNTGNFHMVDMVDFDRDGDLDLATGRAFSDDGCYLFLNENNGQNWNEINYDPNGNLYTGVVADLDGDGDNDVVGPSKFYGVVNYYLNETPGSPPGPLESFSVELIDGIEGKLSWSDTSLLSASYEIERMTAGKVWEPLVFLPRDDTEFIDESLYSTETYRYRIRSFNGAGFSSWDTSNNLTTWPQVSQVFITPKSGNYITPPIITLTTETPDSDIFYSLNGSTPDTNSIVYEAPFLISSSSTLKARAYKTRFISSSILTEEYNVAVNGNFPPYANAGSDQSINSLESVSLDGSASSDLDDPVENLTFAWVQLAGPTSFISSPQFRIASFIPPTSGLYKFELTVSDESSSDKDTVEIMVNDFSQNLIAYFPMDDISGLIAELVNDQNGVPINGISYLPLDGKVIGALKFDGNSARIEAPPIDINGSALTISMWINPSDFDNVEGRLISKASGTSGNDHLWMISQNNGTALRFRLKTSSGETTTLISNTGVLTAGQWQHVVARYDGNNMEIFLDGDAIAATAKTGRIATDNTLKLAIGNQPSGAGERPFSGLIDELKIFNSALSSAQILELYEDTCPSFFSLNNLSVSNDNTLSSRTEINIKNVTISPLATLTLKAPIVSISNNLAIQNGGMLRIFKTNNCE